LQAQVLGGEQDFGFAKRLTRCLELMRELIGVGSNLVEARQHDQAGQSGIQGGGPRWRFN